MSPRLLQRVMRGSALLLLGFTPVLSSAEPAFHLGHAYPPSSVSSEKQEYIVMLKDGIDADDVASAHKASVSKKFSASLNGFAGSINPALIDDLKADPRVRLVEPDYVVTAFATATEAPSTGYLRIAADKNPINNLDSITHKADADIAIIDTGIDLTHPDLTVYKNVNFVSAGRNGNDDNGHGTHVAGIAAAKDNTIGVIGVAPGARLWAVKVLDKNGAGRMSSIISGIDYVTQHADEIDVANMSLGCNCTSQALTDAINRAVAKGVVFVAAAGNESRDASSFSPANVPVVIAVSAIADYDGKAGGLSSATCYPETDDTFADYSNYGPIVDIAAPGTCIKSTWKNGAYNTISGTSMASPHVAGAAALYISTKGRAINAAGVDTIKNALITAATAQTAVGGFSGDPDAQKEPLLNAQSL